MNLPHLETRRNDIAPQRRFVIGGRLVKLSSEVVRRPRGLVRERGCCAPKASRQSAPAVMLKLAVRPVYRMLRANLGEFIGE